MCYVLSMTVRLLLLLSAELSCAIAQEREAEKTAMEEPPVLLSYKSPDGEIPIASKEDGYVSYDELSARKSADPNVSDQPENLGETTAPENQFLKFWENNTCLLKLRTTDGMFNNCTWFRRDHVVNSSVKLTRCSYFQNHQYGRETGKENWKMGKDNSATFLDGFDYTVKKLLYQDEGGNCAVFMYRDFMNADEGLKESLEEECKTEKGERCTPVPEEDEEYFCKGDTHYELLVREASMTDVPQKCIDFYLNQTCNRPENKNENLVGCTCTCM